MKDILDLAENNLCELADLSALKNLKELNLNQNRFGQFPLSLTKLTHLKTLNMIRNYSNFSSKITPMSFHHDLSKMTGLETLRINISGMRNQEYYFMERFKELIPNCEVTIGY